MSEHWRCRQAGSGLVSRDVKIRPSLFSGVFVHRIIFLYFRECLCPEKISCNFGSVFSPLRFYILGSVCASDKIIIFFGSVNALLRLLFGSVFSPLRFYIFGSVCVDITVRNAVLCEYHSN